MMLILEDYKWCLFNASSDLNARAVVMKTCLLEKELSAFTKVVAEMGAAANKINTIKYTIRIASNAVAFDGRIASGNVTVTLSPGNELLNQINA